MASKGMMTGMLGVYLTAAEFTHRRFIASTTSRNAVAADVLVTDQRCRKAWSIQVKSATNVNGTFWRMGGRKPELASDAYVYVFVDINGDARPIYFVVPSAEVIHRVTEKKTKIDSKLYYEMWQKDIQEYKEGWRLFGDPLGES